MSPFGYFTGHENGSTPITVKSKQWNCSYKTGSITDAQEKNYWIPYEKLWYVLWYLKYSR